MTIQVMKTKAEQALGEQFEAVRAALPGTAAVAQARRKAIGAFEALGLPHRRIEEWKYTDLREKLKQAYPPLDGSGVAASPGEIDAALGPLAALDAARIVFVNGAFRPELSRGNLPRGVNVAPLASAADDLPRLAVSDSDAVIALNTAFMSDGAIIDVAGDAAPEKPLLLVFARAGEAAGAATTRNVVTVGNRARFTLVEAHVALDGAGIGQANALSEIAIGDGAEVAHMKFTTDGANATHLSTWMAEIGAAADYKVFQFTSDTGLARNNLFVTFAGEGSKLDISGAFLARGTEHIDTTLVVDHAVPACQSRELFKGVLDGSARGIFQGKVIVRPDAQKTDGKQMAQALMLSENVEFDSKPELEIYADDVVCGHGSTAAELDPDLMFYCRSRGIPEDEAKALIIESFIGEAIGQVEDEQIAAALMEAARDWLARPTIEVP